MSPRHYREQLHRHVLQGPGPRAGEPGGLPHAGDIVLLRAPHLQYGQTMTPSQHLKRSL